MPDGIINMEDMNIIFGVTDLMGIHRESVSVDLTKEDPGSVSRNDAGKIEITIPETGATAEFVPRVRAELEALGYTEVELGDEEEDD